MDARLVGLDRRGFAGLERSVVQPVGGFALGITRANSRRVAARRAEKRRLTGRSGKGGSNFSKEAIIDSCGPRDRWRCKKRIETSATFQGYERHAENPIGTSTFSLLLYLPPFLARLCCPFCPFRLTFRPHEDHPEHTTLVAWRNIQYPRYTEVYRMKPKETDSGSIADAKLFPKPFTFSSYHFSFYRLSFLRIPTRQQGKFPTIACTFLARLDSRKYENNSRATGKTKDDSFYYIANYIVILYGSRESKEDFTISFPFFLFSFAKGLKSFAIKFVIN